MLALRRSEIEQQHGRGAVVAGLAIEGDFDHAGGQVARPGALLEPRRDDVAHQLVGADIPDLGARARRVM